MITIFYLDYWGAFSSINAHNRTTRGCFLREGSANTQPACKQQGYNIFHV